MAGDELLARRVVHRLPGMDRVTVRRDLVYAEPDLRFDLYVPDGLASNERRPAVVFVHGDGPPELLRDAKDWGQYESWGRLAAATGLVGVTFNHRSSEWLTKLEEAAGDVDALITHVRADASDLQIDPDHVGLWVCSMGPPMALRSLLRDRPEFLPEVLDADLMEFSPIHQLRTASGPLPPILVARAGREERPWLNPTIDAFVLEALRAGAELDLLNHSAGVHAFDILNDDDRSHDIIAHTLLFLRGHLISRWASPAG